MRKLLVVPLLACLAGCPGGGGGPGSPANLQGAANDLFQLRIAAHSYRDSMNKPLPLSGPTVGLPDGKANVYSWRVLILPFIEQDNIYRMHFSQGQTPADAPTLNDMMPPTYALRGSNTKDGLAHFRRVSLGEGPNEPLIIVQTKDGVPWAQGGNDIVWEKGAARPTLTPPVAGKLMALTGEGTIRTIPDGLSDEALRTALKTGEGATAFGGP